MRKKIETKDKLRTKIELQAHTIDQMGNAVKKLKLEVREYGTACSNANKKLTEAQSINYRANGMQALLKTYLVSVTRSKDKYVIESFNREVLDYLMDG